MTYVVTQVCKGCKDTACVTVCPCDCFHEGPSMLFIDPEHCIDCEACVFECPVEAIFHEDDVPEPNKKDVQLNARMAKVFPSITERKNE